MGGLPPVFIEFLGNTTGVKTAIRGVEGELAGVDATGAGSFKKTGMLGKAAILGLGVAAAEVAKKTVEMAGDFQQQMTRVRTGAGESAANMHLVGQGILSMAGQVGQSTTELTAGLYMVESAGYHGASALKVLQTAAQGAKVGNADLKTTTDAVTTAMNAYKSGAGSVTQVMNALIGTEAEGKTNLEDLAGSMSKVLPTSAAAKVGLNEVLGAMATMTAQGTPAAVAATYLRQTIGMLSNPSAKAADEMKNLGLNSVKVGQELGSKGLAATLTTLTDAIEQHMGPAGTVLIKHLQGAASNATAFQKVLANLPPSQQTYIGALATMVGGTKSMMAALQLTGPHMADFQKNTDGIAEHVKAGGHEVEGWSDVQKNFNQQMDQAKASAGAMGIEIGTILMPYVQQMVVVVAKGATWLTQHSAAAKVAAGIIGGILVFALAAATAWLYEMAVAAALNPMTWIVLAVVALIAALVLLAMHWHQVWDGIKAVTAATVDWLVGAWDGLSDATAGVWRSISGSVTGAWRATAAWITSAWHTVTDPIVSAWRFVSGITTTVWNGITGFLSKWWPLLLVIFFPYIAILVAAWNHFHNFVFSVVQAVWGAVLAFLRMIWTAVLVLARVAWAAVTVAIINPTMAVWHQLQSLWRTMSGWLASIWHGIRAVASSVWGSIRSAMTGPLTSAWHTISTTVGHIKDAIKTGLNGALTAVQDIGGKFVQIGEDIVNGIIQGIGNMAGALMGKLENLAGDALSGAKHFIEGHSPSRLFAREIGEPIGQGIAVGIDDTAHLAHAAVTAVAAGSLAALHTALNAGTGGGFAALAGQLPAHAVLAAMTAAPSAPTLGTLGAGGQAVSQTVNVHVDGSVLTSGDQLVAVVQAGFGRLGARNPVTYPNYSR